MTKSIKICDKCGKEVNWLFEFHRMRIMGYRLEFYEYDKYDLCEKCAEEFIEKYNNYTDSQKEVSF